MIVFFLCVFYFISAVSYRLKKCVITLKSVWLVKSVNNDDRYCVSSYITLLTWVTERNSPNLNSNTCFHAKAYMSPRWPRQLIQLYRGNALLLTAIQTTTNLFFVSENLRLIKRQQRCTWWKSTQLTSLISDMTGYHFHVILLWGNAEPPLEPRDKENVQYYSAT